MMTKEKCPTFTVATNAQANGSSHLVPTPSICLCGTTCKGWGRCICPSCLVRRPGTCEREQTHREHPPSRSLACDRRHTRCPDCHAYDECVLRALPCVGHLAMTRRGNPSRFDWQAFSTVHSSLSREHRDKTSR